MEEKICVRCGKPATRWTRMNLPTPLCEECALEVAEKEWKNYYNNSFCLSDMYMKYMEANQNNNIKFASSIIRNSK